MTEQKRSKGLHIALWVSQVLLAVAFGLSGFMKLVTAPEDLVSSGMSFVNHYSETTVRLIGVSEVLAALGLILPSALRIKPVLTPLAAVGLAVIMLLATYYHITHQEPAVPTVIMFALSVFVAWGRYSKAVIQPK